MVKPDIKKSFSLVEVPEDLSIAIVPYEAPTPLREEMPIPTKEE